MTDSKYISIKGARVNNLKNIDVNIPRNKLVVITGPFRFRKIIARFRHPLCRGTASLRGKPQ